MSSNRSRDRISTEDLRYLREVAIADIADFAQRHPQHAALVERRVAIALCQGAALHFVDGENGVKDFDVWSFFEPRDGTPVFPYRRPRQVPFKRPGFEDSMKKIDLMGRTLPSPVEPDPVEAVQGYLRGRGTSSARYLSEKAVVMLDPIDLLGKVVWLRGGARPA